MERTFATYNLENLGIRPGEESPEIQAKLPEHIACLREVIGRLGADVLACQEIIEPQLFHQLLEGLDYPHVEILQPPENPLSLGLASRFPILSLRHVATAAHLSARDRDERLHFSAKLEFSRPIMEAELDIEDTLVVVYVLHSKSKLPSPLDTGAGEPNWASFGDAGQGRLLSEVARLAQALELRKIIDQRFFEDPGVRLMVMGDFNDTLESESTRILKGDSRAARNPILGAAELYACESAISPGDRYTMIYRGTPQMIDHIMASPAMWADFKRAWIDNEGLKAVGDESWKDPSPGSDHAPLAATFSF